MALDDVGERDQLVGCRVGAGRGEQAGGEAKRAGLQRLLQERGHRVELGRGRRSRLHAHHHETQRIVADQHAGVHGGRRKRGEIIGKGERAERQPRRARAEVVAQELDLAGQRRRDREAAMADDLGGDPLAHLRVRGRIDRQGEVRMSLDVDEARTDGEPGAIDRLHRLARQRRADGRDAPAPNSDVAGPPRRPAAVEQRAAADQDVMGHGIDSRRRGPCCPISPESRAGSTAPWIPA